MEWVDRLGAAAGWMRKVPDPAWEVVDPAMEAEWESCDGDQVFELVEAALADAWDLEELVDGGERMG